MANPARPLSQRREGPAPTIPATAAAPDCAPSTSSPMPDPDGAWYDLTCRVEVCLPHSNGPEEDWGPWMPYLQAVLPSRYRRTDPDREVEVCLDDPAELADRVLEDELPDIVAELFGTYALSRGSFRIRARVEDADHVELAVVEASPERLAPLVLGLACKSLASLQRTARCLVGVVQRAGTDGGQIVKVLQPFLDAPQAHALLSAHAKADRVTAKLSGIKPDWGEISVTAHEDGLTRIGLVRTYDEACHLEGAMFGDPDERETYVVDYQVIRRSEHETTRLMLESLKGAYTVVTSDGRPAEPADLILDVPGNEYGTVHEVGSHDGAEVLGAAVPAGRGV